MSSDREYTEVEVKLHVPDLDAVAERLTSVGAELTRERLYEHNIRYEDAEGSFYDDGIVLRLRQDNRVRLTYKAPTETGTSESGIHNRFEAEVVVDNHDAIDTILKRLGYRQHMVYEKYRTTYEHLGAEVVLDEMPYGNFLEVEGDEDTIETVLSQLNLQDAPRIPYNYGQLFSQVREQLGLAFTDLTFEKFSGIDVPQSIFTQGAPDS